MPLRMEIEKDIERCDTDNMASAARPPLRGRSHRFYGSRRVFVTDAYFLVGTRGWVHLYCRSDSERRGC